MLWRFMQKIFSPSKKNSMCRCFKLWVREIMKKLEHTSTDSKNSRYKLRQELYKIVRDAFLIGISEFLHTCLVINIPTKAFQVICFWFIFNIFESRYFESVKSFARVQNFHRDIQQSNYFFYTTYREKRAFTRSKNKSSRRIQFREFIPVR